MAKRRTKQSYLPRSAGALERVALGRKRSREAYRRNRQREAEAALAGSPSLTSEKLITVTPRTRFERMSLVDFTRVWTLDSGKTLAAVLEDWQASFLRDVAALGPDGRPKYSRILCSLPRQSGKTEMLAAFGCWRTLTIGGETLSVAQDLDQCKLQHGRLIRALRRNPELAARFDLAAHKGNVIPRADGRGSWTFMPFDVASAGGHVVGTLLADEVGQFRSGDWAFISQVMPSPAIPEAQSWFSGFKGSIANKVQGAPLFDLCEQAKTDPTLLCLNVEGRSPASWHTDEFLEAQRKALPSNVFEQLYMNRWSESKDQFLSILMVETAIDKTLDRESEAVSGETIIIGLDVGLVHDATCLSAVAIGNNGIARLIRQRTWQGSHDAPVDLAEVQEATAAWYWSLNAALVVLDPWQGAQLAQALVRAGVTVEVYAFTSRSVELLSAGLYRLFVSGRVKIPDDPNLKAELLSLTVTPTVAGYRWQHPAGSCDDRVVSFALGASPLFQVDVKQPVTTIVEELDMRDYGFDSPDAEFMEADY